MSYRDELKARLGKVFAESLAASRTSKPVVDLEEGDIDRNKDVFNLADPEMFKKAIDNIIAQGNKQFYLEIVNSIPNRIANQIADFVDGKGSQQPEGNIDTTPSEDLSGLVNDPAPEEDNTDLDIGNNEGSEEDLNI